MAEPALRRTPDGEIVITNQAAPSDDAVSVLRVWGPDGPHDLHPASFGLGFGFGLAFLVGTLFVLRIGAFALRLFLFLVVLAVLGVGYAVGEVPLAR
jgi:hypothetical protein